MIKRPNTSEAPPGLAKGQVWRLKHVYIHIVELGARLLHYRMLSFPGEKGVRTQTSGIRVMRDYLKSRHARLINDNFAGAGVQD